MIRRPVPLIVASTLALAAVTACSQSGAARRDASAALADKARLDRDRAATQDRRKADLERAGARARGAAASDIARSGEREARIAADHALSGR